MQKGSLSAGNELFTVGNDGTLCPEPSAECAKFLRRHPDFIYVAPPPEPKPAAVVAPKKPAAKKPAVTKPAAKKRYAKKKKE